MQAWWWSRSSPASTRKRARPGCSSTTSPAAATRKTTTTRRVGLQGRARPLKKLLETRTWPRRGAARLARGAHRRTADEDVGTAVPTWCAHLPSVKTIHPIRVRRRRRRRGPSVCEAILPTHPDRKRGLIHAAANYVRRADDEDKAVYARKGSCAAAGPRHPRVRRRHPPGRREPRRSHRLGITRSDRVRPGSQVNEFENLRIAGIATLTSRVLLYTADEVTPRPGHGYSQAARNIFTQDIKPFGVEVAGGGGRRRQRPRRRDLPHPYDGTIETSETRHGRSVGRDPCFSRTTTRTP